MIIKHPSHSLRKELTLLPETEVDKLKLIRDLEEHMVARDGVGIAANQIGRPERVALIKMFPNEHILPIFNPKIIETHGHTTFMEEGCLSTGETVVVPRHFIVKIEYENVKGERHTLRAKGLLARIIQHELDHLDGKLIIDYKRNTKELIGA